MERAAGDTPRELERADQQAILDNLPALIAYWDRDLRNRLANKAYVDFFGMTPEEIFGRHISEVLGPDLYGRNLPFLERALAGQRQEFDREIPTPSGPRYTQALYLPDIHDGEVRGIFVLVTDISARRRAEVALARAETRFRALFEAAPSATLLADARGTVVSVNQAAGRLFGYDVAELEGMEIDRLIHPEDRASSRAIRDRLFTGQVAHFAEERRYRRADGHTVWAQADVTIVKGTDPDDDSPYVLAQLQDTTVRKSQEERLAYLADHDPLTGVLNRRGLTRELDRQAALAVRGGSAAVLLCDLDNFKSVNDELGHEVGDDLLIHVAHVLQKSVRATDAVGRLGGDEFAVVLPGADIAEAVAVGEEVVRCLDDQPAGRSWSDVPVTVSVGAAGFAPGITVDQVLRDADRAMYAAKAARKRTARSDDTSR
ncbi:MAG TPA: diguanylate cyclase [Nocardioides sp.]|nr:diguanylate cyclase [Nocardioides sp.]